MVDSLSCLGCFWLDEVVTLLVCYGLLFINEVDLVCVNFLYDGRPVRSYLHQNVGISTHRVQRLSEVALSFVSLFSSHCVGQL